MNINNRIFIWFSALVLGSTQQVFGKSEDIQKKYQDPYSSKKFGEVIYHSDRLEGDITNDGIPDMVYFNRDLNAIVFQRGFGENKFRDEKIIWRVPNIRDEKTRILSYKLIPISSSPGSHYVFIRYEDRIYIYTYSKQKSDMHLEVEVDTLTFNQLYQKHKERDKRQ